MTIAWNSGKSINVCHKLAGEYLAANVAYLKLFCEHSYIVLGTLVGNVCTSIYSYSYYCFHNSLDYKQSPLWVYGPLFMFRGNLLDFSNNIVFVFLVFLFLEMVLSLHPVAFCHTIYAKNKDC